MRRHCWMAGLVAVVAAAGLWALPVRAAGDAPGEGARLERLERAVGDLAKLVGRLTREVAALRKQNEQLADELRAGRGDREGRGGRDHAERRGEGDERRRDAARRDGVAEGVVRAVGVEKFDEGRYRKIVVRVGRKSETYYLGPSLGAKRNRHQAELQDMAEGLKAGAAVRIEWISEGDRRWVRQLRVGSGDREQAKREEGGGREQAKREREEAGERAKREGDGDKKRDADAEGQRESRGKFVRLEEKKIGRLEHLAVLVRLDGQDEATTFFVPMHRRGDRWVRNADITELARKLRKGQRVEIVWQMTEGERFIRRLDW